jgi:hypothetical protein
MDLELSENALRALHEFLQEKEVQEKRFEELKQKAEKDFTMNDFKEDWQLSQFWYSPKTCEILAQEAIQNTTKGQSIGCLSSPSAFLALRKIGPERTLYVFEFDKRFNVFEEFVFYDFNEPLELPEMQLDYMIVDPPFLSNECWTKTAQSVKKLIKPGGKILVCTGMVMKDLIEAELDCKPTGFEPRHQNGLSNEFGSFVNYSSKLNSELEG